VRPTAAQVTVYVVYLAAAGGLFLRGRRPARNRTTSPQTT